mgnify:CR=1 FL=1
MTKNYILIIKKLKKNKYKNSPIFGSSFLKSYFLNRKSLTLKKKFQNISFKKKTNDNTFKSLNELNKKKLNSNDKKFLLMLYKKFEVNLALKKRYDVKGKKLTNYETSFVSYLILAKLINKNQLINKLQFLNFLLKIIDTIMLKKKLYFSLENQKFLIDLIELETKLVKNYVK